MRKATACALASGDPLSVLHKDGRWKALDHEGRQIGRMARNRTLPQGMVITRASVQGIFIRWADDEEDEERKRMLRSETWEVVVPRLFPSRESNPTMDRLRTGCAG